MAKPIIDPDPVVVRKREFYFNMVIVLLCLLALAVLCRRVVHGGDQEGGLVAPSSVYDKRGF